MTTLRDALEGAFDTVSETPSESIETTAISDPPPDDSPPAEETASEKTARLRDEAGRFASKAQEDEPTPQAEEVKPARKAPSSWKKDYWGSWDRLATDPELAKLQDYIEQRESEFAKGVSTYRDEAIKSKDLQDAIAPFMPVLQQHGLNPALHVRNLMGAHQALAMGSPEQKLQMFQRLATEYGVPLQGLATGQADPQQFQVLSELNSLKQQLGSFQQTAQQRQEAEMAQQIEAFKVNAPHFEDVRETMAGLLQSGLAADLKTAYEKACRMSDDVWAKVQAEQHAQAQREAAQKAASKKAAAVSTRSSAPTGQKVAVAGNSVRDSLEASFDAVVGSRR